MNHTDLNQLLVGVPADDGRRVFGDEFDPERDGPLLCVLLLENETVTITGEAVGLWALDHCPIEATIIAIARARAHTRTRAEGAGAADDAKGRGECPASLRMALVELARRPVSLTAYEAAFVADVSQRDESRWTARQRRFAQRLVRRVMAA